MGYEAYIFAAFVFLLILAVIYLNHMFKKSRGEDGSRDERERKLYVLYQNLEEEMLALDDDIKRARQEADEKLNRMDEMLRQMEGMSALLKVQMESVREGLTAMPEPKAEAAKPEMAKRELRRVEEKRTPRKRSPRADQVRQMREQGMEAEEIARALAISRGEVELILGIGR